MVWVGSPTRLPFSRRWRSPANVYSITVVWPWPWSHDLNTRPWPRSSEDVLTWQNEISMSRHSKVRARTGHTRRNTDATESIRPIHAVLKGGKMSNDNARNWIFTSGSEQRNINGVISYKSVDEIHESCTRLSSATLAWPTVNLSNWGISGSWNVV